MGVLEPEPGVSQASSMLSGQHYPIGIRVQTQVAEVEALRFECKLAPFCLSMLCPLWHLCPQLEQCWSRHSA